MPFCVAATPIEVQSGSTPWRRRNSATWSRQHRRRVISHESGRAMRNFAIDPPVRTTQRLLYSTQQASTFPAALVDGSPVGAARFSLSSPETVPRWHRRGWRGYCSWRYHLRSAGGVVDCRFPKNFRCSSGRWLPRIGAGVKDGSNPNSQD
jgi:hypothetical protein